VITRKLSEHTLLVILTEEPGACQDIAAINEMTADKCDVDIIIDLSRVEMLASSTVSNLLLLRDRTRADRRKLILYNLAFATKCILTTLGVHDAFQIVDDKADALSSIMTSMN